MTRYITRQRKLLLGYLHEHTDELLPAAQIVDALVAQDVSASAVYRNLAALVDEGVLQCVGKSGSRQGYYRTSCHEHLHLSCKRCGKTYHMDAQESEQIIRTIAREDHFAIDRADTVLYGICADCQSGT